MKVVAPLVHATNFIMSVSACNIHQTVWWSPITSFLNLGHTYFDLRTNYRTRLLRSIEVYRYLYTFRNIKVKGLPQQSEVAQGVPGRLRPRIFLTFRHYKGGRSSTKSTGRLYPRRNPFQRLSQPQGTWFCLGNHGKNPQWHRRELIPGSSD